MSSNHILYEKLTGVYDIVFKPLFVGAVKKTVKHLSDYKVKKVLEVGCGTGYSLDFYPKGMSVVATDLSDQMVELSTQKAKTSDADVKVLNIKNRESVMAEGPYDAVVSFSVITVVSDPQAFLDDLKSYCKPGGHIFIIMHQRGRWFYRVTDLFCELPVRLLFGFTLHRRISDYNLKGLRIVEEKAYSRALGYVYNDLIVLKKDD